MSSSYFQDIVKFSLCDQGYKITLIQSVAGFSLSLSIFEKKFIADNFPRLILS